MIKSGSTHPYIGVSVISKAKFSAPDPVSRSFQKTLVQIRLIENAQITCLVFLRYYSS